MAWTCLRRRHHEVVSFQPSAGLNPANQKLLCGGLGHGRVDRQQLVGGGQPQHLRDRVARAGQRQHAALAVHRPVGPQDHVQRRGVHEAQLGQVDDQRPRLLGDFGVKQLDLIYSVNGGEEKTVTIYGKGAKPMPQVSASHTIYLEELGVPQHDVHYDLPRIRRLAIEAIEAMSDEELADRVGAPVEVVPALRGARDLNEARAYAQAILTPPNRGMTRRCGK